MPVSEFDQIVREVVASTAQTINMNPDHANERYLHHHVSMRFQDSGLILDITGRRASNLHPEWPTFKQCSGITFAAYATVDRELVATLDGKRGGKIDFALGDYDRPSVGIEFWLGRSWNKRAVMDDFYKLLDPRNPFLLAVSHNIILRPNDLARGNDLEKLESGIIWAYEAIAPRLIQVAPLRVERTVIFLVTEVARNGERRHWSLNSSTSTFERGLVFPA